MHAQTFRLAFKIKTNLIPFRQHLRAIALLGIPLIIGQLGAIVQQFADTAMVGQFGTLELSAAGFVGNVFNLVIFFLLGISYSTTPVVGAFFGRKDHVGTARALRESLVVGLIVTILLMAGLTGLYLHLDILHQPEEIIPIARPYYLSLLISLPFLAVFNSLKQFSDALGQTKFPMWVMLWANGINIVLNYILIFGIHLPLCSIPALGLFGAGIATLLSRVFMAGVMAVAVWKSKKYTTAVHQDCRITKHGLWHMTKVGFPISLQLCLEAASFNVCAIFMGWIGSIPIAAHQVMCTIATLCFQVVYGIGAAAAVRISQFRGRGEWLEVRRTAFIALGMSACCIFVLASSIYIGREPLTALFTTSSEVTNLIFALMAPFVLYQCGDCLQITFANALRGIECVKTMMVSAFVAYVLVSIPLSYIFAFVFNFGAVGVWYGIPFGLTTAGLLFFWEFNKQTKRQISSSSQNYIPDYGG